MQPIAQSKVIRDQLFNINQLYPWDQGNSCSYCHNGQSFSWSFTKKKMLPYSYELLMERGWRRCGTYYYKLDLARCCCKQWTIRQDVTKFHIKKDQKKTVRKMLELAYDYIELKGEEDKKKEERKEVKGKIVMDVKEQYKKLMQQLCLKLNALIGNSFEQFIKLIGKNNFVGENLKEKFELKGVIQKLKYFVSKPQTKSDYYCNYIMLLFGLNKRLFRKEYSVVEFVKGVKEWVEKEGKEESYEVEVQRSGYLVISLSDSLKKNKSNEFQIIQINQQNKKEKKMKEEIKQKKEEIKDEKEEFIEIKKDKFKGNFKISSQQIIFGNITIKLVPVDQSQESWKMYQQYCEKIHEKPEKSMSSYVSFLCKSGLNYLDDVTDAPCQKQYIPSWDPQSKYEKPSKIEGRRKKKMGCFHMKYYYKEKLIGIGVVDIVPDGLSSVYFFYDPKYKEYRLGVFSSLIEIQYIRWLQLSFPEFKNYYMGFYIQNNHKMSYKVDYEPVSVLCPVTYTFVEFTPQLRQKIEKILKKQVNSVRLAEEGVDKIADMKFTTDLGVFINQNLKLKFKTQEIKLSQISPEFHVPILNILRNYCETWGRHLYRNFTFTL